MKQRIFLACLAILLALALIGCAAPAPAPSHNLDGLWEAEQGGGTSLFDFSGNMAIYLFIHSYNEELDAIRFATFTISGSTIEFTFHGGHTAAHRFSHTENTISIGLVQFTRVG